MSNGRAHHPPLPGRASPPGAATPGDRRPHRSAAARRRGAIVAATVALLAIHHAAPPAAACCSGEERFWQRCAVTGRTPDSIAVRMVADDRIRSFALTSASLQSAAERLRHPDRALVAVARGDGAGSLTALGVQVGAWARLGVMLGVAAGLLALAVILLPGGVGPLVLGRDALYSSSKWQMLVWFTVLVVGYGATLVLRLWAGGAAFAGGVAVPTNLLVLAGLSAVTFAGAKAIRQVKEDRAAARRRHEPPKPVGAPKPEAAAPAARFPADLVREPGRPPDLARFQLVVVTLLAAGIYVVRVFGCLGHIELACDVSLPDVDSAILGAVGVGQGVYLARKAIAPLGAGGPE